MNIPVDIHPHEITKYLADKRAECLLSSGDEEVLKFRNKKQVMKYIDPSPKIDNVSYPKSSLDKKSMTVRTALYAFLRELRP
jgi:hypothetical protein